MNHRLKSQETARGLISIPTSDTNKRIGMAYQLQQQQNLYLGSARNTISQFHNRGSTGKSHKSLLRIKKKFTANKERMNLIKRTNDPLFGENNNQRGSHINQKYLIAQHQEQIISEGNNQNILFLKNIMNNRRESEAVDQQFVKPISWHKTVRSISKDYDYYDMIVRDLISEIKQKQLQRPTLPTPQPIISRKHKQKRTNTSHQKIGRTNLSPEKDVMRSTQLTFKTSAAKRDSMVFRMNDFASDKIYQKKITSFLEFLYRINFSNSIYVDLSLSNKESKIKIKIGKGNNSPLIKALLERRFWMEIDNQNPNFIWSQETRHSFHKKQKKIGAKTEAKKQQVNQQHKSQRKRKKAKKQQDQYFEKILSKNDVEQCSYMFLKSNATASIYRTCKPQTVSNHIPQNYIIGSKKILFMLMSWYYENIMKINPQIYIPKSYHIKNMTTDQNWKRFQLQNKEKKEMFWLIKPGENTNRGKGIRVAGTSYVHKHIKKQTHSNGEDLTYIVQQYIYPFLYQNRKFDIRHFLLLTSVNGYMKAYWYNEGYIRTSSQAFDLQDIQNHFVHLTNDAIQKNCQNYGKFEQGNKLSYSNFQRYLDTTYPAKKYNFQEQIIDKMKAITTDVARAAFSFMDPQRKGFNFELYGLDFLIDKHFKPYLIQINANPCLETSCPLLSRIIPTLIEHTFRVGLDPLFPPPQHYPPNKRYNLSDRILENLKYQLIFDEKYEGQKYRTLIEEAPGKFSINESAAMLEADTDIFEDQDNNLIENQIDLQEDSPLRSIAQPQPSKKLFQKGQTPKLKLLDSPGRNN